MVPVFSVVEMTVGQGHQPVVFHRRRHPLKGLEVRSVHGHGPPPEVDSHPRERKRLTLSSLEHKEVFRRVVEWFAVVDRGLMDQVMVARQDHRRLLQPLHLSQEPTQHIIRDTLVVKNVAHQQQHVATVIGHRVHHSRQRIRRLGMAGDVAQVGVRGMYETQFVCRHILS